MNLDIDWFVRLPGRAFVRFCHRPLQAMAEAMAAWVKTMVAGVKSASSGSVAVEKRLDWIFHSVLVELPKRLLRAVEPLKTEEIRTLLECHLYVDTVCFIASGHMDRTLVMS